MRPVAPVVLAVAVAWLAPRSAAQADTLLLDGPPACASLGGQWDYGTCRVTRLIVQAPDTVVVHETVGLAVDGTSYNYGRLAPRGTFQQFGVLHNRGTLVTEGLTVPSGVLINAGTFVNRGWIHTHGVIENHGVFENESPGFMETCSGPVINHAYFHNASALDNWGGLVVNHGVLVNDGSIYNPDGDYSIVDSGALENRGSIDNGGRFSVPCGGVVYGEGRFDGTPPDYAECAPGPAARLLAARVRDLGRPPGGILSKLDALALVDALAPLAKAPSGLAPEGPLHVRLFVERVQALREAGRLPVHWAAALVAWAERLLAMPLPD
jgi:hypothetical protein